jgi:hypothetical protein
MHECDVQHMTLQSAVSSCGQVDRLFVHKQSPTTVSDPVTRNRRSVRPRAQ